MSLRLRSWLRTYLGPEPGSPALRAGSPSAEKDGPRPRAQRHTFQQQGKEHPLAPATRSHGRAGGCCPRLHPAPQRHGWTARRSQKAFSTPGFPHHPRHRAAASPGPSGFPAIWCIRGQHPAPSKGWILSRFLLFLSPGNPFLLNLAVWLCPAGRCLSRDFPAAMGKPGASVSSRSELPFVGACGVTAQPAACPMSDGEEHPPAPSA